MEASFRPTTKSITELDCLLLASCCSGDKEGVESYLAPHSFARRQARWQQNKVLWIFLTPSPKKKNIAPSGVKAAELTFSTDTETVR